MTADSPRNEPLTERELATLLAALLYWREEIAQTGNRSARPYLRSVGRGAIQPLSAAEIEQLSARLCTFRTTE